MPTTRHDIYTDMLEEQMGEQPALDPFQDDEPIACGIENPEVCESCQ